MNKIEHIGIAVKDLKTANTVYEALLGAAPYKLEVVESEGVSTSFFKVGESKIELLEASYADSPIAKFIDKRGEGIHHIAYEVTDIHAERERLIRQGFQAIGQVRQGADNKLVCFFHPKTTHGVLVELCQERS